MGILGRGGSYDLPPRLFRQCLDPRKQRARPVEEPEFVSCFGTFWDNQQKRTVRLYLGTVRCYLVKAYRAASSSGFTAQSLSREKEGAAQYAIDRSGERSGGAADARPLDCNFASNTRLFRRVKKSPGTYVIPGQVHPQVKNTPGQVAMGCQNHQNFEWSEAKCREELC